MSLIIITWILWLDWFGGRLEAGGGGAVGDPADADHVVGGDLGELGKPRYDGHEADLQDAVSGHGEVARLELEVLVGFADHVAGLQLGNRDVDVGTCDGGGTTIGISKYLDLRLSSHRYQ